jgi:hypothetical protein
LGYRTNQDAQKSELKLAQRTEHPIYQNLKTKNLYEKSTIYKTYFLTLKTSRMS